MATRKKVSANKELYGLEKELERSKANARKLDKLRKELENLKVKARKLDEKTTRIKTVKQMEDSIIETDKEKEELEKFVDKHVQSKPKNKSYVTLYIIVVCCVLLAFGALERNRPLVIISGIGFVFLIISWVYKQVGG